MKITIFELLGMIKDGKAPKKIKYLGKIYDYEDSDYFGSDYGYLFDRYNVSGILNDEVEILEEEKKIPEKLSTWFSVETKQSKELNIEYANTNFENMYEKINEIIDYLKSKGE